jgi:hypothetical protein
LLPGTAAVLGIRDWGTLRRSANAQDITDNWFGKVLRVDVNADDFPADPLRNYAIPPSNPFVGEEGDDETSWSRR